MTTTTTTTTTTDTADLWEQARYLRCAIDDLANLLREAYPGRSFEVEALARALGYCLTDSGEQMAKRLDELADNIQHQIVKHVGE